MNFLFSVLELLKKKIFCFRRNGLRSSQRLAPQPPIERREISLNVSNESTARDENENVPDDYSMFKRCHQDPVRMSNLSISSCISVTSTTSAYSRKKRRAPPPPRPREPLETPKVNSLFLSQTQH